MAHFDTLSNELQLIARNELNEVPERVEEDLAYIRKWLEKQPHIKALADDHALLIFLRYSKFSLEKTKQRLEMFYSIKTALPDVFKNRDPFAEIVQYFFEENILAVLPNTKDGPTCFLVRFEAIDPDNLHPLDVLKIITMVLDVTLTEFANTSVVGVAAIVDLKNTSAKNFFNYTPTILKTALICLVKGYALRFKSLHCINAPQVFYSIYKFIKSFLPQKLANRVFCHTSNYADGIQEHFPSSILPYEYGGEVGTMKSLNKQLKIKLESYSNWFKENEQYVCNEEKRPSSSKVDINLHSLDGSFRKLEID